jgi:hypothetical protein
MPCIIKNIQQLIKLNLIIIKILTTLIRKTKTLTIEIETIIEKEETTTTAITIIAITIKRIVITTVTIIAITVIETIIEGIVTRKRKRLIQLNCTDITLMGSSKVKVF